MAYKIVCYHLYFMYEKAQVQKAVLLRSCPEVTQLTSGKVRNQTQAVQLRPHREVDGLGELKDIDLR